jgi:hypothetical protein
VRGVVSGSVPLVVGKVTVICWTLRLVLGFGGVVVGRVLGTGADAGADADAGDGDSDVGRREKMMSR